MTGLIIKLGPKERILINGAVIQNGDRRSRLSVLTPRANILRLRDAIHPDKAITPVTRICYHLQLVLSGDISEESGKVHIIEQIDKLARVLTDSISHSALAHVRQAITRGRYYQALKALKLLLPLENRLLDGAAE